MLLSEVPSFDDLIDSVDELAMLLDRVLNAQNEAQVLGLHVSQLLYREINRHPRRFVISLALFTDCLRVAEAVIKADDYVSDAESDYVYPLVARVARALGRERSNYRQFLAPDVGEFLAYYREDHELFGYDCTATRWIGLEICRRASSETRDGEPLELYRRLQTSLIDQVCILSSVTPADAGNNEHLREVFDLRQRLLHPDIAAYERDDARLEAFLSQQSPEVFSSVAAPSQVWSRDPLDVDEVHSDARRAFESLLDRVKSQAADGQAAGTISSMHGGANIDIDIGAERPSSRRRNRLGTDAGGARGRILLMLGDSGCGKTHLMRAFRTHVHDGRLGFVGYLQLTSRSNDYAAYILRSLIGSLDRPYSAPEETRTGLSILSDAVAEAGEVLSAEELRRLRPSPDDVDQPVDADTGAHAHFIGRMVDRLLTLPGFQRIDPDLLRALLYLQQKNPAIDNRVFKYLRCEPLNDYDSQLLGGIAARSSEQAQRTLEELGMLMWHAAGAAMVILIDQLEDLHNLDDVGARFRRAVDVVRHLTDYVPSSVVVIACLDDLYTVLRTQVGRSALDRLEKDPSRILLTSRRSVDEIEAIVGRRLEHLYEEMDVRWRPDDPLFPFPREFLARQAQQRVRDILDTCRDFHERCIDAGQLIDANDGPTASAAKPGPDDAAKMAAIDGAWQTHCEDYADTIPDEEGALIGLIERALYAVMTEFSYDAQIECTHDGEVLRIGFQRASQPKQTFTLGLCNKDPRGGGLARQLEQLSRSAHGDNGDTLVMVRSSAFPTGNKTKAAKICAALMRKGARQVVIHSAEWRELMAALSFIDSHGSNDGRAADDMLPRWRKAGNPLSRLDCVRSMLALDEQLTLKGTGTAGENKPTPATAGGKPDGAPDTGPEIGLDGDGDAKTSAKSPQGDKGGPTAPARVIALGHTSSLRSQPVDLDLDQLKRHAAFLGSTGSGKTTLALSIIEQALACGIPTVLVDRKGDLCRYAQEEFWTTPLPDSDMEARKQALRQKIHVDLYTPGNPQGRPLGLPVIPTALAGATSFERRSIAQQAANALGAMMKQRQSGQSERIQMTILARAIELLGANADDGGPPPSDNAAAIEIVLDLIDRRDDALVNEVGRLAKKKHFEQLMESLELVRQINHHLLGGASELVGQGPAEFLDPGSLFRPVAGKTRLTILSSKFLGDNATIEFWVARLAVEVARWSSKHPATTLQGLLFFDEADIYMPAQSKPATKEPMQDLLKRARSAGVGVLLGTQNPGDLDYRSRENVLTWFVGRITEERNRGKLKSLLDDRGISRLGRMKPGEFLLSRDSKTTELKARWALMATEQLSEDEILSLARASLSTAQPR